MILTNEEVEHIAHLARLRLTQEEVGLYREQLSAILEYAGRLQAVDTLAISPTSSVLALKSILRPDEPRKGLTIEEVLRNAPQVDQGRFKVPPVLE
jgi:aspartyl-tRNA(Asn)/glutamyl-tRNA(Gln) amidotransferase subunit C